MNDRELLEMAAKAVSYDADTGSMTWLRKPDGENDAARWNSRYAGKECGTIDDKGYRRISFRFGSGSTFKVRTHRLAWFIVYGHPPHWEIDHINQNKLDNRMANLRDVPKELNQRNGTRKSTNTSGIPGVCWHKQREKWVAQASVNGKHHHLGLFVDIQEAERTVKAFRAANGFTENHGRAIVRSAAAIGKAMP
jgi:hypothetical protein